MLYNLRLNLIANASPSGKVAMTSKYIFLASPNAKSFFSTLYKPSKASSFLPTWLYCTANCVLSSRLPGSCSTLSCSTYISGESNASKANSNFAYKLE